MRRLVYLALSFALGMFVNVNARVLDNGKVNVEQGERIPGVLIIKFAPEVMPFGAKMQSNGATMGIATADAINAQYGLTDYRPLFPRAETSFKSGPRAASEADRWHKLEFDPSADLDKIAAAYADLIEVAKVEFDYYAYIMRTPNDPTYPDMYQMNQANDRDMDMPEAWESTVGNPNVVLADTDTGVLYTHIDLQSNIWINPGEDLDGDRVIMDPSDMDGIDSDTNGYIDDLIGWDFVSGGSAIWPGEDGLTQDNDPNDFNGHGTHTSGTVAAVTNNSNGVAGVAGGFGATEPGCKIMCLRMGYSYNDGGSEGGRTSMSYVAEAFTYAYRNGAVAINYSFGSSNGGGIEEATDSTTANEVVICGSAGNSSATVTSYLQQRPDVLCVASTNSSDTKSSFSSFGAVVDVSAPGSGIWSTVSNHYSPGYAPFNGTSMAAPQVCGQVGLIRSLNPLLTRQEVFDIIINSTDNIDALNPSYVGLLGSGRINMANSLQNLASTNFAADPVVGQAPLAVQFADSSLTTPTAWLWQFGDGDSSTLQNPSHEFAPGLYDVSLRTETAIGDGFKTKYSFVSALAETLSAIDASAEAGVPVAVDIYALNNQPISEIILPIAATNIPLTATFDSIVTTGCRTDYFEYKQLVYDNRGVGQACIRLRVDNTFDGSPQPLAPGSGPIARLWFKMKTNANPANAIAIDTATLGLSAYQLEFTSPVIDYIPTFHPGTLDVFVMVCDITADGVHDIVDVVSIVDIIFRGGALPIPPDRVDCNCDNVYNVSDVVKEVDIAFRGAAIPICP